jgi:hypothetical protein
LLFPGIQAEHLSEPGPETVKLSSSPGVARLGCGDFHEGQLSEMMTICLTTRQGVLTSELLALCEDAAS